MAGIPEESIQYHIEIQGNHLGNQMDGDVMVVLDLDGQELPEYVAQTIMELARSRGQRALPAGDASFSSNADTATIYVNDDSETKMDICVSSDGHIHNGNAVSSAPSVSHVDTVTLGSKEAFHDVIDEKHTGIIKDAEDGKMTLPVDVRVDAGIQCELMAENQPKSNQSSSDISVLGMNNVEQDDTQEPAGTNSEDTSNLCTEEDPVKPEAVKEFSCEDCSYVFKSEIDLGRHAQSIHRIKKPYQCFLCDKAFEKELSYHIHTLSHKTVTVFKGRKGFFSCPICGFQCRLKQQLQMHFKTSHPSQEIFACALCRFACLVEDELRDHNISQRHKTNSAKHSVCPICSAPCRKVDEHIAQMHPNGRPYLCTKCGHKSKTESALHTHMLTHIDKKDYSCTECNAAFKSLSRLKRHAKKHDPVKKFSCSECSFATNESYDFQRHMQRIHTRKACFKCRECNSTFFKAVELKWHAMSKHNSKDVFYCEYCDFSCRSKADFRGHMQRHTRKNRFTCDKCDFSTPWKCHYSRHMAVHSDVKPYVCDKCGYRCREKVNLKKHMVVHSDEKPFSCQICNYKCKLKSMLKNHHRVVHTETRPYCCTYCSYTAKTAGNLKKHMWIHEQYKPFKCAHCPYKCREGSKLRRHESKKHKEVVVKEDNVDVNKEENPIRFLRVDIGHPPKPVLLDLGATTMNV